ncbi:radical SAM/SPASM domain-containing protein [Geotalea uraniireducens]|uniref:Radical SAM domain protein n=1 Tax=Geotalea uraniireducens (strain Rf4) TaxID=351605 RepID=A5G474_GEOUR|nr:radical SAM/SPASM domain-containing protein [Geotalea uraniireducens]ABQ26592.1 Radical SAM domain protein [Geotalea uraniireducens Rf4]
MSIQSSAALQWDSPPVPALREYPSRLFVETTSRCNLSCVMCMKQNPDHTACDGDLDLQTFTALEPAFHNLEALVLNGVGEPLLNPNLEQFITRAKKLMPTDSWVGFQTNGLLLTNMRAVTLLDAGLDRICLSMDGVDATTFGAIRAGSQLLDLEWALKALASAKGVCSRPDLQIGVEYVVMRDNLEQLPAALEWAAERGADFAIVSHLHPFDEPHLNQCAYDICTDEALLLFQTWKSKADIVGVDILRYFEILWKYSKSPDEQRIVDFVEAIKSDAQDRGIALDLKRLFNMDYTRLEETLAVFDRATEIAGRTGLDLRLPEIVRRERRGCNFVEQGGAFISWDGRMHPCYHLWHQCRSFANGWLHPVQSRIFGSVAESGVLEIWNSKEFRTYRENVQRHDYPVCSSCNCSPCDLVQKDTFAQDCYANAEPCGSCLWSSGVFRCLD